MSGMGKKQSRKMANSKSMCVCCREEGRGSNLNKGMGRDSATRVTLKQRSAGGKGEGRGGRSGEVGN